MEVLANGKPVKVGDKIKIVNLEPPDLLFELVVRRVGEASNMHIGDIGTVTRLDYKDGTFVATNDAWNHSCSGIGEHGVWIQPNWAELIEE
jgi:hypothetical protein